MLVAGAVPETLKVPGSTQTLLTLAPVPSSSSTQSRTRCGRRGSSVAKYEKQHLNVAGSEDKGQCENGGRSRLDERSKTKRSGQR